MKQFLFPGDVICESAGYIKGYGTNIHNQNIVSTIFGKESRINKLITVNPYFYFRYTPEVGDVVVGRVTRIFNKKWKIFSNSKFETTLSLSAVNLEGFTQRRKLESDEIDMINIFGINDLVVCEVQKVGKTGAAALHTRNEKYGKLRNGRLLMLTLFLLSPLKCRFLTRDNINVIVGSNGFVWVSSQFMNENTLKNIAILCERLKVLNDSQLLINVEKELIEAPFV